jgi:hypothetical protein
MSDIDKFHQTAGEYPSSLNEVQSEFHIAGDFAPLGLNGLHVETGDPTGLYHLMLGDGQNAFVGNGKLTSSGTGHLEIDEASGLGGTSLINANVFLRADDATLSMEEWPPEIRQYGSLDKCAIRNPVISREWLTNVHRLQSC